MDISIKITNSPNQNHISDLEVWLKDEYKKRKGFYCHWDMIQKAFNNKTLLVLTVNGKAIGFLLYRVVTTWIINIELLEIHPKFRKSGYGKVFTHYAIDFFKGSGVLLLELQCSPPESIKFWRKMNFIEFPNVSFWQNIHDAKKMYLPLIPTAKPLKNPKTNRLSNYVELWDEEPFEAEDENPNWVWSIDYKKSTNKLVKPIIFPCCSQWRIRIWKDGKIILDDKYKYVLKTDEDFWGFIYLTKLS